ncbi:MAG: PhzF family phenazine biosynthesis protein [Vicinamibacterales bacterium]
MSLPLFIVDAFAEAPFGGNSAAVCLLDEDAASDWLQAVAAELRQPATAFLWPDTSAGLFRLRWFAPASELALCGHGTLAAAHVLWETGMLSRDAPARFQTGRGPLAARLAGDRVALDFPAEPVHETSPAPGLVEALGVVPTSVLRSTLDYLVEVDSEAVVRHVRPDFNRLRLVDTRGVIVTARAAGRGEVVQDRPDRGDSSVERAPDFVSRFFAPRVGLDEDAVTGSAHAALGPYWGRRLGRSTLHAYQASARGGAIGIRLSEDRVELSGRAVTVMTGGLLPQIPRR